MEEDWEENFYRVKEDLETYSVVLQEKASQALEADSDRVFHHWRGEVRRDIEDFKSLYLECRELDALARTLKVDEEEEREEEVRLALEKYHTRAIANEYEDDIGDAVGHHMDREEEAKISEILAHGNSTHALRHTIHQYERLLHQIDQRFEEIEVETPYSPQEYDSETVEKNPEENPDRPADLTEEFFSKTEI